MDEEAPPLSKEHKKRILSVLLGRLLTMHKSIMTIFTLVHTLVLLLVILHMFTTGTIESEN